LTGAVVSQSTICLGHHSMQLCSVEIQKYFGKVFLNHAVQNTKYCQKVVYDE